MAGSNGHRDRKTTNGMAAERDNRPRREGLELARLLMVLSSLSPLFILWAVRGNDLIPDRYFIGACAFMVVVPTTFLLWRIHTAQRENDKRELTIGASEDQRSHVLVYLFATLLPFYREELATCRDLMAMILALAFIVFLFWRLNLHYMNVCFAIFGYKVFTVSPPRDENPYTGREPFILITCRRSLLPDDRLVAYRLSDSVYMEMKT